MKYKDTFKWSEYDIGTTSLTEHKIDTRNANPIRIKPFRLPQAAQEEVERHVGTILEKNITSITTG